MPPAQPPSSASVAASTRSAAQPAVLTGRGGCCSLGASTADSWSVLHCVCGGGAGGEGGGWGFEEGQVGRERQVGKAGGRGKRGCKDQPKLTQNKEGEERRTRAKKDPGPLSKAAEAVAGGPAGSRLTPSPELLQELGASLQRLLAAASRRRQQLLGRLQHGALVQQDLHVVAVVFVLVLVLVVVVVVAGGGGMGCGCGWCWKPCVNR